MRVHDQRDAAMLDALKADLDSAVQRRSRQNLLTTLSAGAWIYGASQYGRGIAAAMARLGLPCSGFIDQQGDTLKEINHLPVLTPNTFTPEMAAGHSLIFGLVGPNHAADKILDFAKDMPFRDRLWNADLPEVFGENAGHMWLGPRSQLLQNFASIRLVAETLADKTSFDTYCSLIRYRITGRHADYPGYDYVSQYLPPDLPGFDRPIEFVDGGAYTGDTGAMLIKRGVQLTAWYGFEPDPQNFVRLAKTVRDSAIPAALFPCGLSDQIQQLHFESNLGMGSHLAAPGTENTVVIQCLAFDDAVPNAAPGFIKLDVEGGERAALLGMKRSIAQHRPRLAVSAYHRPADLWEIPQLLLELEPGAKLFLRQHGYNSYETVAYAIP